MAAKQAVVEYSTENLQPPILTIQDAIQQSSYFQIPTFLSPKPVGDYNQGVSKADHTLSAEVHTTWCFLLFQRPKGGAYSET
jgi:hypothetical protein